MENSASEIYNGATKRKFLECLKEHETDILQYRPTTQLARFYFNNHQSYIDFSKLHILIPWNNAIDGPQNESTENMVRRNEVSEDNISYNIHKLWMHMLK